MLNPLDYRDPKAPEPERPFSVSAIIRRIISDNIWTAGSIGFTIGFNLLIWICMKILPNEFFALLLLLNYVSAPISVLLTPLVWMRSELHYETDTARILLVAFHLFQSVLLPYFCVVFVLRL